MFNVLKKKEVDCMELLGEGKVTYLSSSCCNPMAAQEDEIFLSDIKSAMGNFNKDYELVVETITSAQASLRNPGASLSDSQQSTVDKIMYLFSNEGLSVFPMLVISGDLAFYGGIPDQEKIIEKMKSSQQLH